MHLPAPPPSPSTPLVAALVEGASRRAGPMEQVTARLLQVFTEKGLLEVWPRFALALMSDPRFGIERALVGDEARKAAADLIARLDAEVVAYGGIARWGTTIEQVGDVRRAQDRDACEAPNIYAADGADAITQVFVANETGFSTGQMLVKARKVASNAVACYAAEQARAAGFPFDGATYVKANRDHLAWQLYKLEQLINDAQSRDITEACRANEHALAHDE